MQHIEIFIINQQLCNSYRKKNIVLENKDKSCKVRIAIHQQCTFILSPGQHKISLSLLEKYMYLREIDESILTNPYSNLEKSMYQTRRNCANFRLPAISNALLFFVQVSTSFLCLSGEKSRSMDLKDNSNEGQVKPTSLCLVVQLCVQSWTLVDVRCDLISALFLIYEDFVCYSVKINIGQCSLPVTICLCFFFQM